MVRLTINTNTVQSMLKRALDAGHNLAPAFRVAAMRLHQDTMRNFAEGGWFPQKWAPLKHRQGRILVDRAILRNSLHASSGADFACVGTNLKYAAVHQFGLQHNVIIRPRKAKALRFSIGGQTMFRRSVTLRAGAIPARPFLPRDSSGSLHPDTSRFLEQTFARHILKEVQA